MNSTVNSIICLCCCFIIIHVRNTYSSLDLCRLMFTVKVHTVSNKHKNEKINPFLKAFLKATDGNSRSRIRYTGVPYGSGSLSKRYGSGTLLGQATVRDQENKFVVMIV